MTHAVRPTEPRAADSLVPGIDCHPIGHYGSLDRVSKGARPRFLLRAAGAQEARASTRAGAVLRTGRGNMRNRLVTIALIVGVSAFLVSPAGAVSTAWTAGHLTKAVKALVRQNTADNKRDKGQRIAIAALQNADMLQAAINDGIITGVEIIPGGYRITLGDGSTYDVLHGSNGLNGLDGAPGLNGSNGANGVDGAPGLNGERGTDGAPGLQGNPGLDGSNGANGLDGLNGRSAYELAVDLGFEGSVGDFMSSLHGADGANGANGLNGSNGADGAAGANGLDGAPGLDGSNGANGLDGAPGIQGERGLQGLQGLTGAAGAQGPKGDTGAAGAQGQQGPKGDTGPAISTVTVWLCLNTNTGDVKFGGFLATAACAGGPNVVQRQAYLVP